MNRLFEIPYFQQKNQPLEIAFASRNKGHWTTMSTNSFVKNMEDVATAFLNSNIHCGDRIGIVSNNCTEYSLVDLASLMAGLVNVPMYPNISADEYEYILKKTKIKMLFIGNETIYNRLRIALTKIDYPIELYSFEHIENVMHFSVFEQKKDTTLLKKLQQIKKGIKKTDLATIIFTSGTSGTPKGVMLSHENIISNITHTEPFLPKGLKRALSFLPLNHVYERMVVYFFLKNSVSIYFPENVEAVSSAAKEISPNIFTAVPRFIDKVYHKIVTKGSQLKGIKKMLFFWSLRLAKKYKMHNKNNSLFYQLKLCIARRLVFAKWQEALGGKLVCIISGSAALRPELCRIFCAAGIPIMEGYGLTETSPVIAVNPINAIKSGTVGLPLKNLELHIEKDGELCVRGDTIMMGYYKSNNNQPIDQDGWLHTGDIAEFDQDGYLKITDRKKAMFKLSGGKYVAPQAVENILNSSALIKQSIVVGENQDHPAALIVAEEEVVIEWAKANKVHYTSFKHLLDDEKIKTLYNKEVKTLNQQLSISDRIKKFTLISEEFSIENDNLTPTLKLKRRNIQKKHKQEIKDLFTRAHFLKQI